MKNLAILSLLICLSSISNAQEGFLGADRTVISVAMGAIDNKLIHSDTTYDKRYVFDMYQSEESKITVYYDENEKCVISVTTYDIKYLKIAIDDLNSKYIRYGDRSWMTKDLKVDIQLKIAGKEFAVKYE